MSITDHEPKTLWKHFDELRQIPRCSGNEGAAREWVLGFAKKNGFAAQRDDYGNVVIRVPATAGHETAPITVIQGHLDMVCEKNSDVEHDFTKDPIQLEVDGEWLRAKGTTLGSDNGVGVAAAMAAADDPDVVHGPLELLMTVEEETGLVGAGKLPPGFLEGKRLINLDSEEMGSVFIGCAGGGDSKSTLRLKRIEPPAGAVAHMIRVTGLRGGHSGLDIVEQRGNAIKILARLLWESRRSFRVAVASFDGGNAHNAIPREAHAAVFVPEKEAAAFAGFVDEYASTLAVELGGREKGLKITMEAMGEAPPTVLDAGSQATMLNLLVTLPHGVVAMDYDIPGLVETSNNLAQVRTGDGQVLIHTSSRSSMIPALQAVRDNIRAAVELAGGTTEEDEPYPGWKPNLDSELLKVTKKVHKEVLDSDPEAKAIHAGLECGIILEKFPGMDMISFGPLIQHPHSPDERINVPSVERFWNLLKGVLEELA